MKTGDIRIDKIMPNLNPVWETVDFEDTLEKTPPVSKIKLTALSEIGLLPVIDQGENFIAGYIDNIDYAYSGELPVIIFGDHTRRFKLIDFSFCIGADGCKILKPKPFLDIRFFYNYLWSLNIVSNGYSRHYKFLKEIKVPIPELGEQHRIVARLETLLSGLNNTANRLEIIPVILRRFRQSVLSAACSGRLTADWREANECESAGKLIESISEKRKMKLSHKYRGIIEIGTDYINDTQLDLPETWENTAIANYAVCSRGRFSIRPRNDPRCYNGEYPFIQIGDLPREGGYINSHKQTLNEFGLKTSKMFSKGTVVIAIVGATIANTGILSYDMCFPDSLVGIETDTEAGNKYIEYYLRYVKENIRHISYAGGGQPNIKLETLEPYPIPLPPLSEQEEIVRRVDALFALADSTEQRYEVTKATLARAEKALYKKAFSGEL